MERKMRNATIDQNHDTTWNTTIDWDTEYRMVSDVRIASGDEWPAIDDQTLVLRYRASMEADAPKIFPYDQAAHVYITTAWDSEDIAQWERDHFWQAVEDLDNEQ